MKVSGRVVHGNGDGRKIGFPTANIALDQELFLDFGVYACQFTVRGVTYDAILHYGPRFVFAQGKPIFEVHLFGFDQDIYEEFVDVEVRDFIRPTLNFPSVQDMVQEIIRDCKKAHEFLTRYQKTA